MDNLNNLLPAIIYLASVLSAVIGIGKSIKPLILIFHEMETLKNTVEKTQKSLGITIENASRIESLERHERENYEALKTLIADNKIVKKALIEICSNIVPQGNRASLDKVKTELMQAL